MIRNAVTHAFIAGELDRPFYARTDLAKYPLGVALAKNFTIDFRGGLKSRPGFEFCDLGLGPARLFSFPTGETTPPVLAVITAGRTFLWQTGEYYTEEAITVTAFSVGDRTLTLTSAATLNEGDYIYLNGNSSYTFPFKIATIAGDVITIECALPVDFALAAVTSVSPLTSFTNPYGSACLPLLRTSFRLNKLIITCVNQPPYQLLFEDEFQFSEIAFTASGAAPSGLALTTYKITGTGETRVLTAETGAAYVIYTVTGIDEEGRESIIARPLVTADAYNFTTDPGSAKLTWTGVASARSYRVYRSIVTENELDISVPLGFVGETPIVEFVDDNVVPDFTRLPPIEFSPFANGAVLQLNVTNPGSEYAPNTATITVATGDFVGYPIIRGGKILGVLVVRPGSGYSTSTTVTVSKLSFFHPGSGGAVKITKVTPASGNNPAANTVFQQRSVYAGTPNLPLTFSASRIGSPETFSSASPPAPDDAFSFAVDAEEPNPIRHLIRARNGLLILHSRGIDRLIGTEGKTVSATSREIENQSDIGVGTATPAILNDDVIFSSARGSSIISMGYTFYTNSYSPQDISILAAHLFGEGKKPIRMEWIAEPDKLLWVLREDGVLLTLTYMKEQEIFAWAQHETAGTVLDIVRMGEPNQDALYALILRGTVHSLEKLAKRQIPAAGISELIASDSALVREFETPQTEVTGLWALEGKTVSVLADGDALLDLEVSGGALSVPAAARTFVIGLPYTCTGVTLPLSDPEQFIEGKKKRIVGLAARLLETRGLELGTDVRAIYEMKDRGFEDWGDVTELRSDNALAFVAAQWKRDAQLIFRQRYPLPAHVLGYVLQAEEAD